MEAHIPTTQHCAFCNSDRGVLVSLCECKEILYHEDCLIGAVKKAGVVKCPKCKTTFKTQFIIDMQEFVESYCLRKDLSDDDEDSSDDDEVYDENFPDDDEDSFDDDANPPNNSTQTSADCIAMHMGYNPYNCLGLRVGYRDRTTWFGRHLQSLAPRNTRNDIIAASFHFLCIAAMFSFPGLFGLILLIFHITMFQYWKKEYPY